MGDSEPNGGTDARLRVFLIAGEPSGDVLGAGLIRALRDRVGARLELIGVGGPQMRDAGLEPLFPMSDLSVMGLLEVLPRIPRLKRRIAETVDAARRAKPAVVVTIDSPGFTYRVAKKLRLLGDGAPIVHYVAPTVWAWKPKRAAKTAALFDHMLTLFPFEPPYFEREGLATTYVGHPALADRGKGDAAGFRARHGLDPDQPVIAMLPGSRRGEVRRHLPVLADVAEGLLAGGSPAPEIFLPVPETVGAFVREQVANWTVPGRIIDTSERHDLFAAARGAVAKSGTVTLEVAIAGVPFVTIYKANPLTVAIVRRMIRIPYVTLANILVGRLVVPELIQRDCTAADVLRELRPLLVDGPARSKQIDALKEATDILALEGTDASSRAADIVLHVAEAHSA